MCKRLPVCFVALLATFVSFRQADAAIYTLDTSQSSFNFGPDNQGWFAQTSTSQSASGSNYFIGSQFGIDTRNFFTFVIATLGPFETIVSAQLQLRRGTSFAGNEATETIGFFDVSTPANVLNQFSGVNSGIYTDLGTGTSYGNFNVSGQGGTEEVLLFNLNAAAISNITSGQGGFFSIGGTLMSRDSNDGLFANTNDTGLQRLVLQTEVNTPPPGPEPSSFVLLGGLGVLSCVAGVNRRRRRT